MGMMDQVTEAMNTFYRTVDNISFYFGYTTQETWKNLESEYGEQVANGYRDWMEE